MIIIVGVVESAIHLKSCIVTVVCLFQRNNLINFFLGDHDITTRTGTSNSFCNIIEGPLHTFLEIYVMYACIINNN